MFGRGYKEECIWKVLRDSKKHIDMICGNTGIKNSFSTYICSKDKIGKYHWTFKIGIKYTYSCSGKNKTIRMDDVFSVDVGVGGTYFYQDEEEVCKLLHYEFNRLATVISIERLEGT